MSLELRQRAVACRFWRYTPGMVVGWSRVLPGPRLALKTGWAWRGVVLADPYVLNGETFVPVGWPMADGQTPSTGGPWPSDLLPDLEAPATLGCLLGLVREAWRRPDVGMTFVEIPGFTGWSVGPTRLSLAIGLTEAEALIAALEAAENG